MKTSSENRFIRRYLMNKSKKGRLKNGSSERVYADNRGVEYPYAWVARVSSFFNFISGCFKNGFPVVVPRLVYVAWAFYPFFFIRKGVNYNAISVLNHERIHIRQQRDIHITVSLPLLVLCLIGETFFGFNTLLVLCIIPFIPTILYGVEMLRSWYLLWKRNKRDDFYLPITFNSVRWNNSFEREATKCSYNQNYLFERKFWAVLAYTGWKRFKNYGG